MHLGAKYGRRKKPRAILSSAPNEAKSLQKTEIPAGNAEHSKEDSSELMKRLAKPDLPHLSASEFLQQLAATVPDCNYLERLKDEPLLYVFPYTRTKLKIFYYSEANGFSAQHDGSGNLIPLPSLTNDLSLKIPGMLTLAALLTNKYILAIDCSKLVPAIHIPPSVLTPPALTPTALQESKTHLPYIDFLPFPHFRDNLLRAGDVVQSNEMWNDLISGKLRVWGKTPWDRRGWEMQEEFVNKWWWVISDDILEETNFWRVSRGEAPLLLRLPQRQGLS
jgi:hypothetical protein